MPTGVYRHYWPDYYPAYVRPRPDVATLTKVAAPVTGHGGLHHIECGIGDVGSGPRVPQTLHTINHGIAT